MRRLLPAALGSEKCDLVIRGGRIANVLSFEFELADVAIKDGYIVGVGGGYSAREEVDADGLLIVPGLIDGHVHIESSMLTPGEFARAVMAHGTTTIMPDAHEIANCCGMSGLEYMRREGCDTPLDMYFGAPCCVPASEFETPYSSLTDLHVIECFTRELSHHLGEVMNYPGVIAGSEDVWSKIDAALDLVKTGHAPGISGRELCAYLLSGCRSDHECNTAEEALEKLRRGMWIMMRDGGSLHNIPALAKILTEDHTRWARCMAVSDDLSPSYLVKNGHMGHKVRLLIESGVRPLVALAMVTTNPAKYFHLRDRGAIAPGMLADIAAITSLEEFSVQHVWKRGRLVASGGAPLFEAPPSTAITLPRYDPSKVKIKMDDLRVRATGRSLRVIDAQPNDILTKELLVEPCVENGYVAADPDAGIAKIVIAERNAGTGRIGVGFIRGIGPKRGAIGTSVAHDAHNFMAIGSDDESIMTALDLLVKHGGGKCATRGSEVLEHLPLPIGGLMCELDVHELAEKDRKLDSAAVLLGAPGSAPFMDASFMSLSVVPELRMTDRGYIDLARGGIVPLFADQDDHA